MKHILNNITEEEKRSILNQYEGKLNLFTENFAKLSNSKLGNVKPIITESEEDWVSSSEEMDSETDYGKMEIPQNLAHNEDFQKLVNILKDNPEATEQLSQELEESLNEEYDYFDYTDAQPKKITKSEYWKRKLLTVGLGSAVGALMGACMTGFSAHDVLEMALAMATGAGVISNVLISNVSREKKSEVDETAMMVDPYTLEATDKGNVKITNKETGVNHVYSMQAKKLGLWWDCDIKDFPGGTKIKIVANGETYIVGADKNQIKSLLKAGFGDQTLTEKLTSGTTSQEVKFNKIY